MVWQWQIFSEIGLFSSPIAGPPLGPLTVRLNEAERPTGSVVFDPTSRRAAYIGLVAGEREVFSSPLKTTGQRFNVTATLSADFISKMRPRVEREAHDVSARLLSEAGRGVSQSVGNHLRMQRADIGPYSQPTERPPASTQPPCGGTRPVMSYASPSFS